MTPVRQNRARPPPCMRWRGPCLATLGQVSQLPGLPDPAGRPLVPCTRDRYRFPDLCHVPRSCPREWYPFPTVKAFLLPRRVPRKGLRQSYGEIFAIHTLSTERGRLSAVSEGLSTGLCTTLPQITGGNPGNTPDMHFGCASAPAWGCGSVIAADRPAGVDEADGRACGPGRHQGQVHRRERLRTGRRTCQVDPPW